MRFTDKEAEAGKEHIAWHAKRAWGDARPLTGPLVVRVIAVFGIPPSWPDKLKAAARESRVMHVQDPDLDQLVKQVKDALKGIAYVDDNQVCGYPNSAKRYGGPERTDIVIEALPQREDEITPAQRRLEKRIEVEGWDAVLAPPARRKARQDDPGPSSPPSGDRATGAVTDNRTKSKSRDRFPPQLQRRIDAALARDAGRG